MCEGTGLVGFTFSGVLRDFVGRFLNGTLRAEEEAGFRGN